MDPVIEAASLRALRELRGYDQRELARRAGISQSIISRLERCLQANLDAAVLVALARALGTGVDALLATPTEPRPSPLVSELAVVMPELGQLPDADQRRVAAVLRAYLLATPDRKPALRRETHSDVDNDMRP